MLKIESRRWVAVWYRCPSCGAQSAELMLTPWRWAHRQPRECLGYKCYRTELEVVERKWYTTFCFETGLSRTTIAGTAATIGPFKLCDIVHRDIRAFRRWYRRRAEMDQQARLYHEREKQLEVEVAAADQADDFDSFFDVE